MIIRNRATKTLKASPLNSRGYERSEPPRIPSVLVISTLKESPNAVDGARLQRAFHCFSLSAGPTDAAAEAATLCLPFDATIQSGATAYNLTYTSGYNINAASVEAITANQAVLVTATAGDYKFTPKPSWGSELKTSGQTSANGVLIGNYDADYVVPTNDYILTNHSGVVGFRKANGTNKVQANRAYMHVTYSSGAPEFFGINFDGEITAIDKVVVEKEMTGEVYNLQGVRMQGDNLPKGIYVKNGKKFIVK